MIKFLLALSCWLISGMLLAQNPENGRVFTPEEIPQVHILIDNDSLSQLYEVDNWFENHEYPATFVWVDMQGIDTLYNIGLRFRGNTSRTKAKKSFKVSFNTYIPGRRFYGLKKLNLNAETNDPSMLRSYAAWKLFRDYGVPASRSNHVEVYINGDYYGLYQNCEHINDDFMDERFGDDGGNLYKCSYPADLNFISNNPDAYKLIPDWGDTRTYELKTNEEVDDYSKLARFVNFLNQSSNADFECRFQDHFNVYNYLKVAAIDVLTGNWDGYIWNINNYYLYEHPRTGRLEYLPYDLDNTWGITWPGIDWADRSLYNWGHDDQNRVLYDRIMSTPAYRDIFSWHIRTLLEEHYYTAAHQSHLENKQDQIAPSAIADTFRPLDFAYSIDDFLGGLDENFGNHVWYGIFPFAETRSSSANIQVEQNDIAPIIWEVRENFADFPSSLGVSVRTDGPELASLVLAFSANGGDWESINAESVGDAHSFTIQLPQGLNYVDYNITATGVNGLTRTAWCEERRVHHGSNGPGIVINEVMASNSSTIADEHGDFDDWIELYNASSSPINLTNYYLVDKDEAPRYWELPPVTMEPGQFLLVWADGQPEQGPLHSNFKVSASGEGIYLFQEVFNGIRVVDLVQVPATPTDLSYGRAVDAGIPWAYFDAPTPGSSNHILSTSPILQADALRVFPNPTHDRLHWGATVPYTLMDLTGRQLRHGVGEYIDMGAYASGLYMLRLDSGVHRVVKH